MPFREKLKRVIYLTLQKYRIVPKNSFNYLKLSRQINFFYLYSFIEPVEGCVVECGVSQGGSLATFKMLSIAEGKNRKLYGFDTFAGLPDPATFEGGAKGQFAVSKAGVVQFFKDADIPMGGVTLVEGDIRETLKDFVEPIAFLHIDVDLYEGYKAALDLLWDCVTEGGVVLFDEYKNQDWIGANRAVDEFVKTNGLTLKRLNFSDRYYLVK